MKNDLLDFNRILKTARLGEGYVKKHFSAGGRV